MDFVTHEMPYVVYAIHLFCLWSNLTTLLCDCQINCFLRWVYFSTNYYFFSVLFVADVYLLQLQKYDMPGQTSSSSAGLPVTPGASPIKVNQNAKSLGKFSHS